MIGTKVKITKDTAKWYLDNPDAFLYANGTKEDSTYDTVMQIAIATLLGEDVVGTVVKRGAEDGNGGYNWGVEFKTPYGNDFSYFEYPRSIVKVKGD